MRIEGYFSKLAIARLLAGCMGVAILSMTAGFAVAQAPAPAAPALESMSTPDGYTAHHSVDIGGRLTNEVGSGQMYNTLVNLRSGPRLLGSTLDMHALPGKKNTPVDNLTIFSTGFGGDPLNVARLNATKGKYYELSVLFRRDRQYFDYDLLGNPGIPSGYSIPISGSTTPYAWSTVNSSPFMFNTVRRMTDTSLTLLPVSTVTFRFAYSKNIFQGPSMTPSGNAVAGSELILEEYQRNSTDDFTAAVDWKPVQGTKLTYEEQIDHYKGDSFFTVAPQSLTVQESDGTKVALLASYSTFMPYGYNAAGNFEPYSTGTGATATSGVCNASIANPANILYANPNGLPIIDPACNVISSYLRSQPTRELFPTEIFRLQSSSIKNLAMNGNIRYTSANMNMPNYYEIYQGLDAATRELASTGNASAQRKVMAVDYGIVWQAAKTVSLSDEVTYSNVHQPGTANLTGGTTVKVSTTAPNETINNISTLATTVATTGAGPGMPSEGGPTIGGPQADYFSQKWLANNATVAWDPGARSTFSLTYRYRSHLIGEGIPHNAPILLTCQYSADPACGTVTIHENGGIFNAGLRPANNWDLNGSVEIFYADNILTPVAPRQTRHYRVHTLYRPKPWATVSAAFNDLERHNNTNNTGTTSAVGPLMHVDHSRVFSLGAELNPNEHYGLDLSYSYSDVYTATNICFEGAASVLPGGAIAPAAGLQSGNLCLPVSAGHGSNTILYGPAKDFDDAPTQFLSAAVMLSPNTKFKSHIGYRLSDVNGSRFFTDAGDVNGTTVSKYQTPFLNLSYAVHPDLIFKLNYDYYGYGEGGGKSGAQYCNDNPTLAVGSTSAPTVACSSVPNTAMSSATPIYGFTNPRDFHANNITVGFHYEF
jgi:hypothetical protein